MLLTVTIIFVLALVAPLIVKLFKGKGGAILSLFPAILFVFFTSTFFPEIRFGETLTKEFTWFPALNIHLSFYLDGLSFLFTLLILGIGALILFYSNGYMKPHKHKGRFYAFMFLFMGSMLGLVLSGNLVSLFIFWELTSISSFFLIGFYNKKEIARKSALQALLVTEIGGLALLSGIILLGIIGGSFDIVDLVNNSETIKSSPFYTTILILMLAGAFSKSAQFPFHFWLPGAMAAPTPVSAYLHSATMVKAGIYLLARMMPVLGGSALWHDTLVIIGSITMFLGAFLALTQKDLKAILAYTTINALGVLIMLIGTGTQTAIKAMLLYVIVHALYKASLFMVAGAIDEKTGTRNIYMLGNLHKEMPFVTIFSIPVLLSMAGLPPMLGYISKELIYEARLHATYLNYVILVLNILSNVLMLTISAIITYQVFFRKKRKLPEKPHKSGLSFWLGLAIMSIASLGLALFPRRIEPILEFSIAAIKDRMIEVDLQLWHGVNEAFFLTIVTIALGAFLYAIRSKLLKFMEYLDGKLAKIDFALTFDKAIEAILYFSKKKTGILQHGYHRIYLITIFLVGSLLLWHKIIVSWNVLSLNSLQNISFYTAGIVIIMIAGSIISIRTHAKLAAIVVMGLVGYGLAIIFMIYGAVDLAITQFVVETLTLVLFVLVVIRLPQFSRFSSRNTRMRDSAIALLSGGVMAVLAFLSFHNRATDTVSDFFIANSKSLAHGKNIVNVILVDFRALDTTGEVMVLAITSLGVLALIGINKKYSEEKPKKKESNKSK